MKVRWTRRALRALDGIAEYIALDSPVTAQRTIVPLETAITHLAEQPSQGRAGRVAGTRELAVPGTPFIVPYRVRDDCVEILTLLHSSRRWPDDF